jgi:AcrR family transcriptional regulator
VTTGIAAATGRDGKATRRRIVSATIDCVRRVGAGEASMAAIAGTAGVSKALLHYHYTDRARLLAEVVTTLARALDAREDAAMRGTEGSGAVDGLWRWVESELALGELRVLLELSLVREPAVRAAAVDASRQRHRAAGRTVSLIFERLGLSPKVPVALLGNASLAFLDGLALRDAEATEEARVSFDIFWFGLLGIAE